MEITTAESQDNHQTALKLYKAFLQSARDSLEELYKKAKSMHLEKFFLLEVRGDAVYCPVGFEIASYYRDPQDIRIKVRRLFESYDAVLFSLMSVYNMGVYDEYKLIQVNERPVLSNYKWGKSKSFSFDTVSEATKQLVADTGTEFNISHVWGLS